MCNKDYAILTVDAILVKVNQPNPQFVMGDFNYVREPDEKKFGREVTMYETKDLNTCGIQLGLSNLNSIGCFFTMNNNTVRDKLDCVMVIGCFMVSIYRFS